jgi:hypothetical protein
MSRHEATPSLRRVWRRSRISQERDAPVPVLEHMSRQQCGWPLVLGPQVVGVARRAAGKQDNRDVPALELLDDLVLDCSAQKHQAVHAIGEVEHLGGDVPSPVGGQDEDAASFGGRAILVPEDDGGVVRTREVGEDDAGGVVPAAGQRAPEATRPVAKISRRIKNPFSRGRCDKVRLTLSPRDGRDRHAGASGDLVDCGSRTPPSAVGCKRFHPGIRSGKNGAQ